MCAKLISKGEKMNETEDKLLTDEELDEIAGGRTYVYELVHGPKGDYYKCTTTDGFKKICIGADKWDKWLERLAQNGDKIKPLKK